MKSAVLLMVSCVFLFLALSYMPGNIITSLLIFWLSIKLIFRWIISFLVIFIYDITCCCCYCYKVIEVEGAVSKPGILRCVHRKEFPGKCGSDGGKVCFEDFRKVGQTFELCKCRTYVRPIEKGPKHLCTCSRPC